MSSGSDPSILKGIIGNLEDRQRFEIDPVTAIIPSTARRFNIFNRGFCCESAEAPSPPCSFDSFSISALTFSSGLATFDRLKHIVSNKFVQFMSG